MRDTDINATIEQYHALLRHDFVAFTRKVFLTLNPGREFKRNWHHEVIAYQVTEMIEGRCQRLIINIPPRYLKSIMMSVALPAFILGHAPRKRIICASYGQELASKLSRDCRTVMESDWYRLVFPATKLDPAHNTENDFGTTERGLRYATSVGGVLTGLGGDVVIIDDPIKPADALSAKSRESVLEWFNNTVSTRLDDKNNGAMLIIMQRLHLDDLTGHLRRAGGWRIIDIPPRGCRSNENGYVSTIITSSDTYSAARRFRVGIRRLALASSRIIPSERRGSSTVTNTTFSMFAVSG
jgi:hypothetical protein